MTHPTPSSERASLLNEAADYLTKDGAVMDWSRAQKAARLLRSLARASLPAPTGWQPIETAPEGTMILCANMKAMEARNWAFVAWIAGGKICGHRMDMPTHWMPLPTAPSESKPDQEPRPPYCGSGHCSCIECLCGEKPRGSKPDQETGAGQGDGRVG